VDKRAQDILDAGRAVLSQLGGMIGDDAAGLEPELREALEGAQEEWQAEIVREILRDHPATRAYLEDRVPAAKSPRSLSGRDIPRRD
jgi:hypothetical protein